MPKNVELGDRVWVPSNDHAWICGTVSNKKGEVMSEFGNIVLDENAMQSLEHCGRHVDDRVENLVDIDELSEGAILHHVRKRFMNQEIYTHVGAILVAVNPFEHLNIYGQDDIKKAANVANTYPHVFIAASIAYQQLSVNRKNQSVLISGESGAGKTETTKKVLNYLANVAPGKKDKKKKNPHDSPEPSIEDKILQSNPLLEALGNAKTLRNNNSSRFGKWMQVNFDHSYHIEGCEIVNYLLEKSRIVSQNTNERNYHVFYLLLSGAAPSFRESCGLLSANQYSYLNQSGCYTIEGVDDASDYLEVLTAMNTLGFNKVLQESILKIIAAILHIGNISFESGASEDSSIISAGSATHVEYCIELLGFDRAAFNFALTDKTVQMGKGSVVGIQLTPAQAVDSKDTLSKALYSNLFDWIIRNINNTLKHADSPFSIGILDIFGYEVFDVNSFEQLCINYANEKLQFHFNEVIFSEEMKMYEEEGVRTDNISFVDNSQCVQLIEHRLVGLLSLLDEECSLGKATDLTYASKIDQAFGKNRPSENPFYDKNKTRPEAFIVKHFAGSVEYCVVNFLDKNKDAISSTLQDVAASSSDSLVSDLFMPTQDSNTAPTGRRSTRSANKSTLGGQFRNQLIGLLGILQQTEPHFIRCIKPNHQKKPGIFDGHLVLRQLRYAGLFEAIRIRQSGYSYRVTHGIFVRHFTTLVDGLYVKILFNQVTHAEAALSILEDCTAQGIIKRDAWQVGKSKVFIKTSEDRVHLERHRLKCVEGIVVRLQAFVRGCITRCRVWKSKYERIRKQRALQEEELKKRREWEAALLLRGGNATIIQKIVRGFLCRRMKSVLKDLITLRSDLALRKADTAEKKVVLSDLPAPVQRELTVAQTMIKLIRIQDHCLSNLTKTLEADVNVVELDKLVAMAEKLDLSNHPIVDKAKQKLTETDRKRSVMIKLVQFLRAEDESVYASIENTVAEARAQGVDEDFISEVQMLYENTSPRLQARYHLRQSVETLDAVGLQDGILEIELLQKHYPGFAEMELRAARGLSRMMELERCLTGRNFDDFVEGGRLTDRMLELCNDMCQNYHNKNELKLLRFKLYKLCGTKDKFDMVIWAYKWSRTFSVWKHEVEVPPGVAVSPSATSDPVVAMGWRYYSSQQEFFGLRLREMAGCGHVMRSLHPKACSEEGNITPPAITAAIKQLSPRKQTLSTPDKTTRDTLSFTDKNRGNKTPSTSASTPKSASRSPFNSYGAVPDGRFSTPPLTSAERYAKTSPARSPQAMYMHSPGSGGNGSVSMSGGRRKGSTHFLSFGEKRHNIAGLRTEFNRLPVELEDQLLDSRSALEKQKAVIETTKQKSNLHSPKKDWF